VTLRAAAPREAGDLAGIFVRCWRSAYRGVVHDEIIDGLTVRGAEAWWRCLIEDPASKVVVAWRESGVLGMVRFGPDPDDARRGHLHSLYVDPPASGAGVGRTLLQHATAELSAAGYTIATLWVFRANERAIRLYRAAGWRGDGAERVEPEWGAPERRMTIRLRERSEA
jgi:ribosomal protein S18 acetylase RimI-like enzyme